VEQAVETASAAAETHGATFRVLNAGAGPRSARPLHPAFAVRDWAEVRLDVDPATGPDIVGSITDMAALAEESFDAVWSSHVLEHLHAHDVPAALAEFRRVLKPDGFALITSPDLETVADLIVRRGVDQLVYVSSAGPITPLDMLFGHSASIARGRSAMGHRTGFTCASLGRLLVEAGFPSVLAKRDGFDLWALALMPAADKAAIQAQLGAAGLDMVDRVD
jgi:SAM-dependent methyltransferase